MQNLVLSKTNKRQFKECVDQFINIGIEFKTRDNSINYTTRDELIEIVEKRKITNDGNPLDILIDDYKLITEKSINFGAKNFMAHPDNGLSIGGIVGDVGKAFLQQNLVNYEYSPIATIMEISLLNQIREIIGYPMVKNENYLAVKAGGAFVMGGYNANLSSLLIAREKLKENLKKMGKIFDSRKTRVLAATPYAHYSLRRSLDILGLGNKDLSEEQLKDLGLDYESVYNVDTKNYKLDLDDLEKKIIAIKEKGEEIMAIYAIAGESRVMAFDDLEGISKIAKKYNIWVHVDACQGGQCLFNKEIKNRLLRGIEYCDSISIDPHKSLLLPYNLSAFFVKNVEDMYLLPKGASVISNDDDSLGKFTPGIGSKNFMSLKLWMLLRNSGWDKISKEVERRGEIAKETVELIKSNYDELFLVNPNPEFNAVMIIYRPKGIILNDIDINELNKKIHSKLTQKGNYILHSFPCKDDLGIVFGDRSKQVYSLRFMFGNPLTTIDEVKLCLDEIVSIGRSIIMQ